MTLQELINRYNGKPVEVEDPSNVDQCMDLAFAWTDSLGIPRAAIRRLYAYQVYTQPNDLTRQHFDIIAKAGIPRAGDLMVWGTSVGVAGHIAIFVSGNSSGFTSFDQNWPPGSKAHLQSHTYSGVLGWLRPKSYNGDIDMQEVQKVWESLNETNKRLDAIRADLSRLYELVDSAFKADRAEISKFYVKLHETNIRLDKLENE